MIRSIYLSTLQMLDYLVNSLLKHFRHDCAELMESVIFDWVHQLNIEVIIYKKSCLLFDLQQHLRKHFEFIVEFLDEQASFEVLGALKYWAEQSLDNVKAFSDVSVVGDLVSLALHMQRSKSVFDNESEFCTSNNLTPASFFN